MFPDVEPAMLARELATHGYQLVIERVLQGHVPRTRIPEKGVLQEKVPLLTEAPRKVWETDAAKRTENLKLRAAWMKQQARQKLQSME